MRSVRIVGKESGGETQVLDWYTGNVIRDIMCIGITIRPGALNQGLITYNDASTEEVWVREFGQ